MRVTLSIFVTFFACSSAVPAAQAAELSDHAKAEIQAFSEHSHFLRQSVKHIRLGTNNITDADLNEATDDSEQSIKRLCSAVGYSLGSVQAVNEDIIAAYGVTKMEMALPAYGVEDMLPAYQQLSSFVKKSDESLKRVVRGLCLGSRHLKVTFKSALTDYLSYRIDVGNVSDFIDRALSETDQARRRKYFPSSP